MTDTSRCPRCGSAGQVELQMRNKGGPQLTMLSCGRCEHRTWLADGETLSKDQVLAVVSGREDLTSPPRN
jgi:hypothetical protein